MVGTVQSRGFLQADIDGCHRRTHDDQIECADRSRQQNRQSCIIQSQLLDVQELGDQSARKIHGEHDQHRDNLLSRNVLPGQKISAQYCHNKVNQRSRHHIKYGIGITDPDSGIGKHFLISLCRKSQRFE